MLDTRADRMSLRNEGLSTSDGSKPKMKNRKCISTKTLLTVCLFTMSMLTVMSMYTALRCLTTNYIADGILITHGQLPLPESLSDLERSGQSGYRKSIVWQSKMSDTAVNRQVSPNRPVKDTYFLKYTELRERNLLLKYPVQGPCKDEKRPAVPCNDTECRTSLLRDPHTSIHSLLSTTRKARMNLINPLEPITADLPNSHVSIVTAASANHYLESQAMIETLHQNVFPRFRNVSFYFYDMGLLKSQVEQMEKHCRCQVIKFPFDSLPPSISNISCYTWKPLIVHAHLPKTNILIWADASVRFNTSQNDDLFEDVIKKGFLSSLSDRYVRPVAHHTAATTFRFFHVDACSVANYQELEASFMAFHNQPFTKDIIVESWAACALAPDCMCPMGSLSMHHCDGGLRQYSKCHRFDQSAISLIMLKLFQEDYVTFIFNHSYYAVQRGSKSKYFDLLERGK